MKLTGVFQWRTSTFIFDLVCKAYKDTRTCQKSMHIISQWTSSLNLASEGSSLSLEVSWSVNTFSFTYMHKLLRWILTQPDLRKRGVSSQENIVEKDNIPLDLVESPRPISPTGNHLCAYSQLKYNTKSWDAKIISQVKGLGWVKEEGTIACTDCKLDVSYTGSTHKQALARVWYSSASIEQRGQLTSINVASAKTIKRTDNLWDDKCCSDVGIVPFG